MSDYPDYTTLMQIIGSDIMVPIDLQASYIMMPVDIQAQYVTLDIDIVAQTVGNININLAASDITLNINLKTSDIALDINIKTSEVTMNVNITAQSISNIDIDFEAQTIGVHLEGEWEVKQGKDVSIGGTAEAAAGAWTEFSYNVTGGKTLFINAFTGYINALDKADYDHHLYCRGLIYDSTADTFHVLIGGVGGFGISLDSPRAFASGHVLKIRILNWTDLVCNVGVEAEGYEV